MLNRITRNLGAAALAATVPFVSQLTPSHAASTSASRQLIPSAWLIDRNTDNHLGYADKRYPDTPVSGEVKALKDRIAAEQARGILPSDRDLSRLAYLVGVPNAAAINGRPLRSVADIGKALRVAMGVGGEVGAAPAAIAAGAGGSCSGNWCWVSTPVETSEPTSDPAGNHPTNLYDPLNGKTYPNSGFFANQCGPGSTTEVIGNWNSSKVQNFSGNHGTGPQAYLLHMGDLEMTDTYQKNSEDQDIYQTSFSKETSTINSEAGTTWYVLDQGPTDSQWPTALLNDFQQSIPPVFGASTSGLVNWSNDPGQSHIVMATSNDDYDKQVKYYDTATSYSSGGSTLGFHQVSRATVETYGLYASIW